MNGIEKLLKIQQELKVPKNQYNSFGKYNFRSAEDILEAVKKIAGHYKVLVIISDEIIHLGERYYVQASVTLKDTESDWEITSRAFAREEENKKGMDGSQITGTASSYARKYALNGLFAIDDTKEFDTPERKEENDKRHKKEEEDKAKEQAERRERATAQQNLITNEQHAKLSEQFIELGYDKEKQSQIFKAYQTESLEQLSIDQADQLIRILEKRVGGR